MAEEREAKVIITADNKQYNKSVEESQKATEKLNKALEKTSESASKITKATAKGLFKIGAAEIAGLTALSTIAATLEKQTSNIQSNLALNKTSSQYNAVTASIRELSRTIPVARGEIAQMATEVSNLGFVSGSQISKVTAQFSKMGVATGESPTALAQNMVQFQRAMGMTPSAQTMAPYQNSTTYLSARAGAPANDILSFAGNIAPAARVAGMNQSTVLGLSTAATRAGVDGTYASSTISQILNDITMLRYSKSPEIKRYSSALGIPVGDLTRQDVNSDTFNRNIISKILEASQSAEGPSKLGLLGFDGLRAKKALQGLSAEPGGVERWIKEAQYGMGTESVQTGFEAASGGLADQMVMLKGQFTDLGQVVGTPTMEAFTIFTKAMNWAAETVQKFVEPFAKLAGIVTGPLATAMIGMSGVLAAWKTFSTVALLKRGTYNTMTSALGSGFVSGQMVARGGDPNIPVNTMAANVMSGDPRRASALQRTVFGVGSALGTMVPGLAPGMARGPFQKTLEGMNRFTNFIGSGTEEWYRRAGMTPEARYADKVAQREAVQKYKTDAAAREARIAQWQQNNPQMTREQILADKQAAKAIGAEPVRPKGMFVPEDKYTVSKTVGRLGLAPVAAAWQATKFAAGEAGGGWNLAKQVGGAAAADFRQGMGASIAGGVGSMARAVMSPQMLAMGGLMFTANSAMKASEETSRWGDKGAGFNGEIINTMTKYNEELGIATTSLQRFAMAVDKANPAKTDDISKELSDAVFKRGSAAGYEMTDPRMKEFVTNQESAKKYLASQGAMNADQTVKVFEDLAAVMSKADWSQLKNWFVAGTGNTGKPSAEMLGMGYGDLAKSLAQSTQDNMSIWQKIGGSFMAVFEGGALDPMGLRSNKESNQSAADYVSMSQQIGSYIGETKEAGNVVKGDLSSTEKSSALARSVEINKQMEALSALTTQFKEAKTPAARAAWFNAKNRVGEMIDVDLSGINPDGESTPENINKTLWSRIYGELQKQAPDDVELQAALSSGLITKEGTMGGVSTNEFIAGLREKKVTTSVDTMIDMSKFKDMSPKEREKWFGEGSVLKDLGTGISDPMKQLAASTKMLQLAQEKYGSSITATDAALQSFKNGLSAADPSYAIIQGAQDLNQIVKGDYYESGGSPQDLIKSRGQRTDEALASADAEQNPADAAERLVGSMKENQQVVIQGYLKLRDARKQTERSTYDFYKSQDWQAEDFYRSQRQSNDDFQRSQQRSKEAYQRQFIHSEKGFYRSLKYQSQDFYRSREREAEQHARSMKYAAEDTAKAIGDPYNRMQLQLLSDPEALASNMENRARLAELHVGNVGKLKGMGLSDAAAQQLNVNDFNNSQQVDYMAKTMTSEDIARFNAVAERLIAAGGDINKGDTSVVRAEQERQIALTQSLDDFVRNMKRTKIEHAIQVNFSQKEFKIGLKVSAEEHEISMDRAEAAFKRAQSRSAEQFQLSLERQREDLVDYFEKYANTQEKMIKQAKEDAKALGLSAENAVTTAMTEAGKSVDKLAEKLAALGKYKIPKIPNQVPKDEPEPASESKTKFDPKRYVYHTAYDRYYDKEAKEYISAAEYNKRKRLNMAEGGIVGPRSGGLKANIAEGGSAEMVLPLNNRGIDFMSQFTKGVAREMTRSMPKTPVSASQINNSYDHSQNVRIEGMVVESNDPKKFLKELKKESQKKNAALYKS